MTVTETASHKVSSWNRRTYQRLKLALSLGLRRQLFVAVCDDLSLRDRLARQLDAEMGVHSAEAPMDASGCPQLVSLNLNLSDPHPLAQIAQWLAQNQQLRSYTPAPGFQILGVELLTRQPPGVQRLFLRRLRTIERNLLRLDSTLLFWLPRPWLHTIERSVPEFWRWHTGVFEFEGEPTPLPPVGSSKPETSPTLPASEEGRGSFKQDLRSLLAHDLVPLGEISEEQPAQRDNAEHLSADIEALIRQTGVAFSPVTNSEEAIANLRLEDVAQELKLPESQVPNFSIDEPVEELKIESLNLQPPTPQEPPASSPAEAYLDLGNHYRHAIEQGDASEENLMIAIQAYEQSLHWIEQGSSQASDILNDIGNLYWMLSRCPTCADHTLSHLEQAIQAYQLALAKLTAEEVPHTYAMIQNNLGAAYGDLARHKEPAENLEQSIRAYEEALRHRRAESEPIKYASTQNNLGTAHWNLAQHQSPVLHLREAIAAYAEALSYYDTKSEPLNWAMIQNNLGTAYWNLAQYEQPETWLNLATLAYQDALQHRTPEVAPAACAATLNNLGTAYWHLGDRYQDEPQQKAEYLDKCIAAYESAIALTNQLSQNTPPVPVNFDVFATHNNLGLAHYQLATEPKLSLAQESKLSHLETALNQHVQACTGVAVESDSYQTALSYIVKTIRAIYHEAGIPGQNRALSNIPGQLLPEILPRL